MFILSIPSLSFLELISAELQELPTLRHLVLHGGTGALNIRTPERGIEDTYLSIGAGAPAIARYEVPILHGDESWQGQSGVDLYNRYHSQKTADFVHSSHSLIVVPEVAAMREYNERSHYHSRIGLLGEQLMAHNIGVYVYGNSDMHEKSFSENLTVKPQRHGVLMLMNGDGLVFGGNVGSHVIKQEPDEPHGFITDENFILQQVQHIDAPAVVLIEHGDLFRLYNEKRRFSHADFETKRMEVLKKIDQFVARLIAIMRPSDHLLVFSPILHEQAVSRKLLLAPMIYYHQNMSESTVMSPTTRQPGIASAYDIAPYILQQFGIAVPQEMTGRGFSWYAMEDAFSTFSKKLQHIRAVYDLRPDLLYPFVTYEVMVMLAALVYVSFVKEKGTRMLILWRTLLLSLLTAPAAMLLAGYVPLTYWWICFLLFILWGSLTFVLLKIPIWRAIFLSAAFNVGLIVMDGCLGAPGMSRSILGYDPMVGARYYGIGNEYMGVLIGASVLAGSLWLQRWGNEGNRIILWRIGTAVVFIFLFMYLALPSLGTNAGGAISAGGTFAIAWFRWFIWDKGKTLSWAKLGMFLMTAGVISIIVLAVTQLFAPWMGSEESHIGRALTSIIEGQFDVIGSIIQRKLAMNWHLLGVSAWSKVLIVSLIILVVMVLRPRGVLQSWQHHIPYVLHGFTANTVGAVIALLVNDSGIVAAATLIVFVVVPMLMLKLVNYSDNRDSHWA